MPLSATPTTSRTRARRALSHSPTRSKLDDDFISPASKPLRRGRKPGNKRRVVKKSPQDPSTLDFDNSFNSSMSNHLNQSFSGMPSEPEQELDFLSKSPVGHQWRNKKLWQSNAGLAQKRYEEYSGRKSLVATPQGMEREMRRKEIRDALMGVDMGMPEL